jgi:A/G-specific adenine glycosylase
VNPGFADRLLDWAVHHGRHDLPWQRERSAYRIWISEVMLQQTQVATVIPYFERFMCRFPDLAALAAAPEAEVLAHWAGLGYYARARNLHRAARAVVAGGATTLPRELRALETLPGIGRSTAAAILALCHGDRHPILDGNVKRVLARHRGIEGDPGRAATLARLWDTAQASTPERAVAEYTQAIMDLGAMVCTRTRPACERCPVAADCVARQSGRICELPTPRTPRAQPWRERWALLLVDAAGAVWLERRPSTGIWGGLLALPEFASEETLRDWCRASALPGPLAARTPIEHGFTHFRLRLQLRQICLPAQAAGWSAPARAGEAREGLWHRPEARDSSHRLGPGLPAPIQRLLEELARERAGRSADGVVTPEAAATDRSFPQAATSTHNRVIHARTEGSLPLRGSNP